MSLDVPKEQDFSKIMEKLVAEGKLERTELANGKVLYTMTKLSIDNVRKAEERNGASSGRSKKTEA